MVETLRVRQVAVIVADETAVAADLSVAFDLSIAYRDPELATYGMRNAILPVGDAFLEIAAPAEDSVPAARYLSRYGDGGFLIVVQTDDLSAAEARIAAAGVGIAHRIDKVQASELQLAHKHVGGCLLSIDEARPADSWVFAGPDWAKHVATDVVDGFAGLDIACRRPDEVASRWSALLGRPVSTVGGTPLVRLDDGCELVFRAAGPAEQERLVGIRLRGRGDAVPPAVRIGSLTISVPPVRRPAGRACQRPSASEH